MPTVARRPSLGASGSKANRQMAEEEILQCPRIFLRYAIIFNRGRFLFVVKLSLANVLFYR